MRVAAGAIARKYLAQRLGVQISGYLAQVGDIRIEPRDMAEVDRNPFFCPDAAAVGKLEALIDQLRREGDSIGARVTVVASGVPPGLGEPVFDRLDADLAHAMMGINAVKGVEVGDGFATVGQRGSQHRDELTPGGLNGNCKVSGPSNPASRLTSTFKFIVPPRTSGAFGCTISM